MKTIEKQLKEALTQLVYANQLSDHYKIKPAGIEAAVIEAKKVLHSYEDALIPYGILDQAKEAIVSMHSGNINGGVPKRFVVATNDGCNLPWWAGSPIIHETYLEVADEWGTRKRLDHLKKYDKKQVFLLVPVELGE